MIFKILTNLTKKDWFCEFVTDNFSAMLLGCCTIKALLRGRMTNPPVAELIETLVISTVDFFRTQEESLATILNIIP